jgi:hypothetical protein
MVTIVWNVASCSLADHYSRFVGCYSFLLHDRNVSVVWKNVLVLVRERERFLFPLKFARPLEATQAVRFRLPNSVTRVRSQATPFSAKARYFHFQTQAPDKLWDPPKFS